MAKNEVSIFVRIQQVGEGVFSRIRAGLSGIGTAIKGVLGATAAVGGFIFGLQRLAEAGERNLAVMARFRGSTQGLGLDTAQVLRTLEKFTHGLVDESDLMELANKGIVDGGLSVTQLGEALEFAQFKARELGQPIADFSKSLVQALASGNLRGSVLEAFPALRLELERLDASGALDSTRKRAQAVALAFSFMRREIPGLREDLKDVPTFAERFGVAIKNAVEEAEKKIASSPSIAKFFEDIQQNITKLIEKLPDLLPRIEGVIGGLVRLSEKLAPLFERLVANLSGTAQDDSNKSLASAIMRTLEVNPKLEGESRDRVLKLFRMIAANIKDGGHLIVESVEQGQALNKALDLLGPQGLSQVGPGAMGHYSVETLYPGLKQALGDAVIAVQQGQHKIATAVEPPSATGNRRRSGILNLGPSANEQVTSFAEAIASLNTAFAGGAKNGAQYQDEVEGLMHGLTDLAGVAEDHLPEALARLRSQVTPETFNKLVEALSKTRDGLAALNPDVESASTRFNKLFAAAEAVAGDTGTARGLGRLRQAWTYLQKKIAEGVPVDKAIEGLNKVEAVGARLAQTLESAFSSAIRGFGEMLAELVAGGSEEFLRSSKDLTAREREVRQEFSQGKLTAQQYQEQLSKLSQERAALNQANNPLKKFAAGMLGTLADLAFSLSTFAFTFGVFKSGLLANPFGVAAAAFAAGVILKAAAAKVGGSIGGMRGDIGNASGVSGFNGQDRQQDQRPIIFVRIIGTTPGESARDYMADVARYQNLGGRTAGVSATSAVVNVPGVVVRMAG